MAAAEEVTQAEFARLRGVSRKAVTKWKSRGLLVLTDDGLVVVAATNERLDDRPTFNRGGATSVAPKALKAESAKSARSRSSRAEKPPRSSVLDTTPEGQAMTQGLTHADAARLKELALARRQMQAFEREQGRLVDIETVARQVEQEYAVVRERLLAIPGKLAAKLVDRTRSEIEAALLEEITEALDELHDPDREGGVQSFAQAEEGPGRAEAAAAAQPRRMG
ncbi:hypothetical protein [Bosea sp. BK604]|uniref:hypothetical protein n=1 Tax=Bosea sp. BK604 TaxID=2512180 RepID=UPI0010446AAF|nr:hypothetical protein [Bosea sp. BK604]